MAAKHWQISRLAAKHEHFLPEAIAATKDEIRKVIVGTETIEDPIEESDVPIWAKVADMGNILALKDMETNESSWKGRSIFRGDRVMVKTRNKFRRLY